MSRLPKCAIEKVDGMCTASGFGYEVLAPKGWCFAGSTAEHIYCAETRREAQQAACFIQRCECAECQPLEVR